MAGTVVVHDRYQNYDAIPGLIHQLCAQHLLRDLADAAETYPDAHWPAEITQALHGLIHAANTARAQGLPAIPDDIAAPLIHAFRHGVLVGLSQVPSVPGRKAATRPRPAGMPARPAGRRAPLHRPTCASRPRRTRQSAT